MASALAAMKLEDLHLYRKVPRDLTDATAVGGAISLSCALVMAFLFISNIQTYMSVNTATDVALDETGEAHMRICKPRHSPATSRRPARPRLSACDWRFQSSTSPWSVCPANSPPSTSRT